MRNERLAARTMASMGYTGVDIAKALGRPKDTMGKMLSEWGVRTRKAHAYQREDDAYRFSALQGGQEAFKRGMVAEVCPYGEDEVAMRCAWMAGYSDAERGLV